MDDEILRRAVRDQLSDTALPDFETVAGGRVKRRVRKLRMGAALLLIILIAAAPIALRPSAPETAIALWEPPTTDWLLRTPDPAWVEQLDHNSNEEPTNVH